MQMEADTDRWSRETKGMDTNIEEECKRRREVGITAWQCRVFNRRLSDLIILSKWTNLTVYIHDRGNTREIERV